MMGEAWGIKNTDKQIKKARHKRFKNRQKDQQTNVQREKLSISVNVLISSKKRTKPTAQKNKSVLLLASAFIFITRPRNCFHH